MKRSVACLLVWILCGVTVLATVTVLILLVTQLSESGLEFA